MIMSVLVFTRSRVHDYDSATEIYRIRLKAILRVLLSKRKAVYKKPTM